MNSMPWFFYLPMGLMWLSTAALAEQKPLWQLGVGPAGLISPHYLGADDSHEYLAPLPYFEYNGERLKADRDGVRGVLLQRDRFEITLTGSGSLPVDSDDSEAREGMPDLEWVLEPGLLFRYSLFDDGASSIRMELPLRAALEVDGGFDHIGWVGFPRIHASADIAKWRLESTFGVIYADRDYHGYFYDVAPRFATADRGEYSARSGQTAVRATLALKRQIGRFFYGGFMTWYNLDGAANREASLVQERNNYAAGFIVAWVFASSQ